MSRLPILLLFSLAAAAPAAGQPPPAPEPRSSGAVASPAAEGAVPATEEAAEPSRFAAVHQKIRAALGGPLGVDRAALWVLRDGEVLDETYFGAYNADSRVPIDTASRWLAAATLMTLVDGGELDLDAPLSTYLEGLTGDEASITARRLLDHSSGLPAQHPCLADPERTLEACAKAILEGTLAARPGAERRFGDASYQVAGYLAEAVSGQPWADLFQRALASPLGMRCTHFGETANPRVGSGARTCIGDYGSFLSMLLEGGKKGLRQVLSAEAVEELLAPARPVGKTVYAPVEGDAALGAHLVGEALLTSPGAFGFTPWIDRERRIAGIFLVLAPPAAAAELAAEVRTGVAEAVEAEMEIVPGAEAGEPEASGS